MAANGQVLLQAGNFIMSSALVRGTRTICNAKITLAMIMKFYLRVYDNFHYMDEDEAYHYGQYETYEKAVIAAKAIVDEFLKENWKAGIKPNELGACYALYGEDPVILPNEHGEYERFSARTYAHSISAEICRKLQGF